MSGYYVIMHLFLCKNYLCIIYDCHCIPSSDELDEESMDPGAESRLTIAAAPQISIPIAVRRNPRRGAK